MSENSNQTDDCLWTPTFVEVIAEHCAKASKLEVARAVFKFREKINPNAAGWMFPHRLSVFKEELKDREKLTMMDVIWLKWLCVEYVAKQFVPADATERWEMADDGLYLPCQEGLRGDILMEQYAGWFQDVDIKYHAGSDPDYFLCVVRFRGRFLANGIEGLDAEGLVRLREQGLNWNRLAPNTSDQ